MNTASDISRTGIGFRIALIVASRVVLNTARRFAYPFAPVLSRGLGVSLTAITSLIAVNQATTILGVLVGPVADRLGHRRIMFMGLGALMIGMSAASLFPVYGAVLLALFLAGVGKTMFDPAVQAYVSDLVPFSRRGMAIGAVEFAWAGSSLLGIPLISFLIDRWGWRAPFFALTVVGLVSLGMLWRFLPEERQRPGRHPAAPSFWQSLRILGRERVALGSIGFAFFLCLAVDNLFVVYGAWLEQAFNLSIVAIGMGTGVIGIAELLGESLTATFGDRVGLKRTVLIGLSGCVVSYFLLPLLGKQLSLALGALFLIFLSTEVTIVSFLSLCTELLPGSRATLMAGFFAASGMGRIAGTLIGGFGWEWGGIWTTGIISALSCGIALIFLLWGLQGWIPQDASSRR